MNAAVAGILTIVVAALSFRCTALKRDAVPVDGEFLAYFRGEERASPNTGGASLIEEVDMQGFDQLISLGHTSRSSLQHHTASLLADPSSPGPEKKERLSVAAVAPAKEESIANAAAEEIARQLSFDDTSRSSSLEHHPARENKLSVADVTAQMNRKERRLTRSPSLQHLPAKKASLSLPAVAPTETSIANDAFPTKKGKSFVAAVAAEMKGREKTFTRTPVRMPGNGWCQDAEGQEATARRVVSIKCMDAQSLCSGDASCVAWACNDDLEMSILYTSTDCEIGCEQTRWLLSPNLIEKAGHDEDGDHDKWRSGACYRWTDEESHPVVPADVVPADDELTLLRKASLSVRVPGNGLCMDASNTDTAARRFIQGDCDRAEHLCGLDVSCVAWNCHDDASKYNAILYTDTDCQEGCKNTRWSNEGPRVIDHAAPVRGKPEFASHSCFKWRS